MIRFARQLALTLAALTLAVLVSFNQDPPEEVRPPEESAQPASSTEAAATQPAPQGDPAQPRERDGRGGGSRDQGLAAFAQQYGSLMQINIFLRDRRVRRETSQQQVSRQQAPPPRPETEWVLSGVVYEEGAFRAYFENVRSGEVKRAAPGEPIAAGQVSSVFIDAIGYQGEGDVVWVEIGHDLTGAVPAALVNLEPAAASSTGAAPPTDARPGASTPSGTLSIEERLRQRRMQERGGSGSGPPPGQGASDQPQRADPPQGDPDDPPPEPPPDGSRQQVPPPDNADGDRSRGG